MDVSMYYNDDGVLIMGRTGSLPSPPSLVANVVLRLILCPLGIMLTWVPMRILWRNGEFSACTYVINLWVLILFVFVNAAIWHNQDFDGWWPGYGWCDLQAFVQYALVTLYSTSVCAIMQRLSSQVALKRVTGLSAREKRRRVLVQSLIIFPVPVLQVIITVFVQGQRYGIAPASGCTNEYEPTALFLVFFVLPPVFFTLLACFHTFQTYRQFREIDSGSQAALGGTNSVAFARRQRARRKLYFMVLCILVPYTPVTAAFAAVDIMEGWPWTYPSSFRKVHIDGPVPYNSISILGVQDLSFITLNMSWIPVVSAFVAFVFFGTSKEAINIYREYLLAIGLGHVFPRLHEVYDPDRTPCNTLASNTSNATTLISTLESVSLSRKGSDALACPSMTESTENVNLPPRPLPVLGLMRRIFCNNSLASSNGADVERGLHPTAWPSTVAERPFAAFSFGFNWATPPMTLPKLSARSRYGMPERSASLSHDVAGRRAASVPLAEPYGTSAPSTSTATAGAPTTPVVPVLASDRLAQPFDGSRNNSSGVRATSTHVWSESGPGPAAALSMNSSTARKQGDDDVHSCDNVGKSQVQHGVLVDCCITTCKIARSEAA
ncbi:a-factor receptor [Sporothrix epigloea]|uniref:A-factor receptor n=1 Tax=Sporothrix epigloea TaxID=1892477 RepID=A0ABP0DZU6_9PEZI